MTFCWRKSKATAKFPYVAGYESADDLRIVRTFSVRKLPHFSGSSAERIYQITGGFMKTGLTTKQKVTGFYFNEHDDLAEIYTHNTELKKRLLAYAKEYPELCQLTEDDEQGGLQFEIDKHRIGIRLTAPYSPKRRLASRQRAKNTSNIIPKFIRYSLDKA